MSTTDQVHVFATIVAQPGKADEVRAALVTLANATRQEPGNLQYMMHEDPKTTGSFYVFEIYKDQAATDAHMKSPHLAAALAAVGKSLASPPVITPTKLFAGS
jgi:quinol monooxygenase YgiN